MLEDLVAWGRGVGGLGVPSYCGWGNGGSGSWGNGKSGTKVSSQMQQVEVVPQAVRPVFNGAEKRPPNKGGLHSA